MADIKLRVQGESGEAVAALDQAGDAVKRTAEETAKAGEKWRAFADAMREAAKLSVEFVKESIAQYVESERVSRQLERAAGDLTEVFDAQSRALSEKLAVDDDVIKKQQTLLLQWGAAPAAIQPSIQAIYDYARATGKDATEATTELIKAVETGGGRLAALGISYEVTGDKGTDLANLTAALAAKFGGAAETDAKSLAGQVSAAKIAFEDLQKAFGEIITDFGSKTGVVSYLTEALKGLTTAITGGDAQQQRYDQKGKLYDELKLINDQLDVLNHMTPEALKNAESLAALKGGKTLFDINARKAEVEAKIAELNAAGAAASAPLSNETRGNSKVGMKGASADGKETFGLSEAEQAAREKRIQDIAEWDEKEEAKAAEKYEKELKDQQEYLAKSEKAEIDHLDAIRKFEADQFKAREEELKKFNTESDKMFTELAHKVEKIAQDAEAKEQIFVNAGYKLGAAMVGALQSEIEKMQDGGEFDVGEFLSAAAVAAVGIAAAAVGTYYLGPAGGQALGTLASLGAKAAIDGVRADEKKNKAKSHHDGGWVQMHSGGWAGAPDMSSDEVPIIAQPGERVMSRAEVARMGGPAGVDSMMAGGRRGGPNVVINITSLDARSSREFFEDKGGQGFRRALISGRGDVAAMLGAGVLR